MNAPPAARPPLLARLVDLRPDEGAALAWSGIYIFAVLASYSIMRPLREQMGVESGIENLPWLFLATLVAMLAVNLPFAWLVSRLPRARFVPLTYRFFAANILLFALVMALTEGERLVWVGRVFFVWLSVFNLFVVSIFWATATDVFSTEQGKRLFAVIATGATLGAIAGAAFTAALARVVPVSVLLVAAAGLLEAAVLAMRRLARISEALHAVPEAARAGQTIGGGVLAGLGRTFASRYLLGIAGFVLLFAITSTFLYFEQAAIARRSFPDRAAQTTFFASVDLAVNLLTLGVQLFLTGRITKAIGVGPTLALLPAASVIGFAALAVSPSLVAIVGFQVLRRAGNFAVARPVREVLFTSVPREDRYKAKSFIDTVVYRTGDQIGAWTHAGLGALGLAGGSPAALAVPLSIAWLVIALRLGRAQTRRQAEAERLG